MYVCRGCLNLQWRAIVIHIVLYNFSFIVLPMSRKVDLLIFIYLYLIIYICIYLFFYLFLFFFWGGGEEDGGGVTRIWAQLLE